MIKNQWQQNYPSAEFCYGRDKFSAEIVNSAFQSRTVLLFGGRQAGKTTLLLRIAKNLKDQQHLQDDLVPLDIPVYVDLMKLPYDAGPTEAFRFIAQQALASSQSYLNNFKLQTLPSDEASAASLDTFITDIRAIFDAAQDSYIRLLFLFDESKRILGQRFPRGFQDNLFALLYGGDSAEIGSRVAIVFAGAQELYRFCEDDTSPIGSRASTHIITNLPFEAVVQIICNNAPEIDPKELQTYASLVYKHTGGQASLSARLSWELVASTLDSDHLVAEVIQRLQTKYVTLFRLWVNSLSTEARYAQEMLCLHKEITLRAVADTLDKKGLDPFMADKAFEELQFIGTAILVDGVLRASNELYWNYVKDFVSDQQGSPAEREIWQLIEEVELTLRMYIGLKYESRWPGTAEEHILALFANEDKEKIERMKRNTLKQYPYSPQSNDSSTMDFLYLGQLGMLIVSRKAWNMFQHLFRDKRQFEDMLLAIAPVRNDRAHFRKVPRRELDRCRIACEDLLTILEKEMNNTQQ